MNLQQAEISSAAGTSALAVAAVSPIVDVRYDYVWDLVGYTSYQAKLNLQTGEVFVSHDLGKAEANDGAWLLREELAVPVHDRDDMFMTVAVRTGARIEPDALADLNRRLLDYRHQRGGNAPCGQDDDTVLD